MYYSFRWAYCYNIHNLYFNLDLCDFFNVLETIIWLFILTDIKNHRSILILTNLLDPHLLNEAYLAFLSSHFFLSVSYIAIELYGVYSCDLIVMFLYRVSAYMLSPGIVLDAWEKQNKNIYQFYNGENSWFNIVIYASCQAKYFGLCYWFFYSMSNCLRYKKLKV